MPWSDPLSVQRSYVADQYSDADKLRVRIETHRLYSQAPKRSSMTCLTRWRLRRDC